jgi:hypothetical protein
MALTTCATPSAGGEGELVANGVMAQKLYGERTRREAGQIDADRHTIASSALVPSSVFSSAVGAVREAERRGWMVY